MMLIVLQYGRYSFLQNCLHQDLGDLDCLRATFEYWSGNLNPAKLQMFEETNFA